MDSIKSTIELEWKKVDRDNPPPFNTPLIVLYYGYLHIKKEYGLAYGYNSVDSLKEHDIGWKDKVNGSPEYYAEYNLSWPKSLDTMISMEYDMKVKSAIEEYNEKQNG